MKASGVWIVIVSLGISGGVWAQVPKSLTTVVTSVSGQKILADTFSKTLYVFDVDQGKPAPACNGGCAEIWPPYLVSDAEAAGLNAPLGVIQRASQQPQLTYKGRPVYTYIFDRQVGDELGNGLGRVWHLVEP